MVYKHQDFSYRQSYNRIIQKNVWNVYVGKTELVATKHLEEDAKALAHNLNMDPWFLDRNQTQKDRANMCA